MRRLRAIARNVLPIVAEQAVLGLLFLGVIVAVSACSPPPEQPDLNTYGAANPVCLVGCWITFTLSEGDGAAGNLTTTVTETIERGNP